MTQKKKTLAIEVAAEDYDSAVEALKDQGIDADAIIEVDVAEDAVGDIYELLEQMTPPHVRAIRMVLGQMGQIWEAIVTQEARLMALEDRDIGKLARIPIIDGALEETIRRERELESLIQLHERDIRELDDFVNAKWKTEGREEEKEKTKKKAAEQRNGDKRGKYCLHCGKVLNPKARNQRIFCSPRHASKWYEEHPGEAAYPRMKLRDGYEATIKPGEGVESDAYTT